MSATRTCDPESEKPTQIDIRIGKEERKAPRFESKRSKAKAI
jgi:hypothetical protein